jgi:assimilatory nitrate reductase electron transfer subunit
MTLPHAGARRLIVVGDGMAGHRLVQEVLERDPDRRLAVTVVGAEPGGAYNRAQLTSVLAGATRAENIELADEQWYAANGVTLRAGTSVVRIDRAARRVDLDDGSRIPYDVLVLATGSTPVQPAADGLVRSDGRLLPGAMAFRTLADCAALGRLAASAKSAVVLGAGVLGLETGRGLAGRGLRVTVVQRGARLMERHLDAGASRVLTRTARSVGIQVRLAAAVLAVHGGRHGNGQGDRWVRGVVLDDGSVLDADLLVLCCGVRPRVELARQAGLAVSAGILVDDQLRSITDPGVFAIGECAEHRGRTYGLVAPAWEQARVAAQVITRPGEPASYPGSLSVMRLKAAGIELASLGDAAPDDADTADDPDGAADADGVEVIRFTDRSRGIYQKLVVREGRLGGAILLGDTRAVGAITQLFDRQAALPADRGALLLARRDPAATAARSPAGLPGRATVCHCNGVTKARICAAWQDGSRRVEEIAARTRATTGCGTCRDAVEGIVAWLAAADAGPAEPLAAPGPARRADFALPSAGAEPALRPEHALLPAGAIAGRRT